MTRRIGGPIDTIALWYSRWLMTAPFREEEGRVGYYPKGRARSGYWLPADDPNLRRLRRLSFLSLATLTVVVVPLTALFSWPGLLPALVIGPVFWLLERRAAARVAAGGYERAPEGWEPHEKRRNVTIFAVLVALFLASVLYAVVVG